MTPPRPQVSLIGLTQNHLLRFLLSGGLNTLLTFGLYLLLLLFLSYRLSYSIAFASGILLAYLLNRSFVFRSHRGVHSIIWMPVIYGAQYLAGLLATWAWVDGLRLDQRLAPLAAIALTFPLNYALSRFAFTTPSTDNEPSMIASSLFRCARWRRGVPTSLLVGCSSAACLVVLYLIIGHIPVNNGAGWDGSVYLRYLQELAAGGALPADPYRTIRLSGFLPLLGAAAFGVSTEALLQLQTVINIGLASAAAALLHDTMRHLGASSRVSTVTLATTLASWVFLVMPFYYPVLSDNVALPLSSLSVWCWARSHRKTLYLTLACSVWLMPGLFLVPLVLAAFPREHECTDAVPVRKAWVLALSVACAAFLLPQLVHLLATFSDAQISSHSSNLGGQTALLSLRTASVAAVVASAGVVLWLLVRAACDPGVWKSLGLGSTVVALLVLGANAVAMFTLIDWTQGFAGPPLLEFMMLQSLAAPFKPLVAHLLAFGPVSLLAIAACFAWGAGYAPWLPKALVLCMVGFLPLLLAGSESRQWIGVLPVAAVLVALSGLRWHQRLWSLAVGIGLALPSFWLPEAILNVLNEGLSFQSPQWQFYFGRQGPWMSTDVYGLGMVILVTWGLVLMGLYVRDRRAAG